MRRGQEGNILEAARNFAGHLADVVENNEPAPAAGEHPEHPCSVESGHKGEKEDNEDVEEKEDPEQPEESKEPIGPIKEDKPDKEKAEEKEGAKKEKKKSLKDKKAKKEKRKAKKGTAGAGSPEECSEKASSSGIKRNREPTEGPCETPPLEERTEEELAKEIARETQAARDLDVERHPGAYHLDPLPARARGSLGVELARKATRTPGSARPSEPDHPPPRHHEGRAATERPRRSRSRRRGTKGSKHNQRGKDRQEFWRAQRAWFRR